MFRRHKKRKQQQHTAKPVVLAHHLTDTGEYKWVPAPGPSEPFPEGMVCGGKLETGQLAYIGRADVVDQTAAGFVLKETREISVPYGTDEHRLQNYDVLVVDDQSILMWEKCSNGQLPTKSLCLPLQVGGRFGERMFVGRTCTPLTDGRTYEGIQLQLSRFALSGNEVSRPGKIHTSHGCMYVPYSGREYIFTTHEMLMVKTTPGSLKRICRWHILNHLQNPNNGSLLSSIEKLPVPAAIKRFLKLELFPSSS